MPAFSGQSKKSLYTKMPICNFSGNHVRFGQNNGQDNGCPVAMTINGLRYAQPRGIAPSCPNSWCHLPPGSISPLRSNFFCHFFSPRKSGFLLWPPPSICCVSLSEHRHFSLSVPLLPGVLIYPETYCHLPEESDCLQTLFCCFQMF